MASTKAIFLSSIFLFNGQVKRHAQDFKKGSLSPSNLLLVTNAHTFCCWDDAASVDTEILLEL